MANKKFWLGILVMILVFGMTVVGCEIPTDEYGNTGGYTFEFKVQKVSHSLSSSGPIIKIEFINGSSKSDPVLATETVYLGNGEMSNVYKVAGFTNKNKDDYRIFGVLLTFENGSTQFEYSSAKNGAKIRASTYGFGGINFYNGSW